VYNLLFEKRSIHENECLIGEKKNCNSVQQLFCWTIDFQTTVKFVNKKFDCVQQLHAYPCCLSILQYTYNITIIIVSTVIIIVILWSSLAVNGRWAVHHYIIIHALTGRQPPIYFNYTTDTVYVTVAYTDWFYKSVGHIFMLRFCTLFYGKYKCTARQRFTERRFFNLSRNTVL
jgi:hypothetical protein